MSRATRSSVVGFMLSLIIVVMSCVTARVYMSNLQEVEMQSNAAIASK